MSRTGSVLFQTAVILLLLFSVSSSAAEDVYMIPEPDLVQVVDAPWPPAIDISPDNSYMLLKTSLRYPPVSELARPELKLAGMRFRPGNSAPSRSRHYVNLELVRLSDLTSVEMTGLPEEIRAMNPFWSPDGTKLAFTLERDEGVELWVVTASTGEAGRLTDPVVSLTANVWPVWLSDSETILFCMVPEGRGEAPVESAIPTGPRVQETAGEQVTVRTLQDLLETPYDEDLFEHYLTSILASVDMDGRVTAISAQGIIWDFDPSPDGRYLLVSRLHRPFPHNVTAGRFPELIQVMNLQGDDVFTVADHSVRDRIPLAIGSTFEGPRSVQWRSDADAALCWVEALDGGDAASEAALRDRILLLDAPFTEAPVELMRTSSRFGWINWCSDSLAFVYEWWWPTRNRRAWIVNPGDPSDEPVLMLDYSWEDRYNDPGSLVNHHDQRGRSVVLTTPDGSVFLSGSGASPEGDRPFLDRLDLRTMETRRLFHSEPPYFERAYGFMDSVGRTLLTGRESATEYPNYFAVDLSEGTERQLTFFENPLPQFTGLHKKLITYTREDGIGLSATLYVPEGFTSDDSPLPLVMWAYPEEYVSADAAGQVSGSPHEFDYIGWWSPLIWLSRGYAVLDNPSMPIIAPEGGQPNDTYIEQLVMNAEAAVAEVVNMGVADPDRIAVGGHSYGAFMTANLLAHSDLFAAGLARTGAYNRTLTPFGFQSEDRSLWEAPEVYWAMSPFLHAHQIKEPLLLIHGDADNNSGTFPMQSERFFAAINGLGGTARLVMLPLESHGYRARESVLHVVWETAQWLDRFVKNREISD